MKLNEFYQSCPECGGPAFTDLILAEKKDACYYKVKASAKVWPSAYASGRLVQCRKKGSANYGNKSEGVAEGSIEKTATGLKHHGDFPDYPGSKGQQFQTDYDRLNKSQTGRLDKALGVRWDPINKRKEISADPAGVAEEWSQKYKSSINCSHPKGFSQRAHCAGKKKHNESIEMEMVCEDCGMCETHVDHQNLDEACWKGYHKEGNKELFGKTVPNCVKNTNEEHNELARILELGGVKLNEELVQEFDLIENIIEDLAERNGVDADMIWEDLDSLTDDELYVFAVTSEPITEDWQKANKRDRTAGMSQKAVNAYRRENPGSKLKTAVTTKPSKLKKGSKASERRKSYCSRSRGQMKMHNISCAKTPDKAICKARRRWNC